MFDVEDKRISTLSSPSRNCNSESIQKTEKVVQWSGSKRQGEDQITVIFTIDRLEGDYLFCLCIRITQYKTVLLFPE